MGKLKLVFYLAEIAENAERHGKLKLVVIFPRITCITRIGQAKAWLYYLAEIAENADYLLAQGLYSRRYR